MALPVVNPCRPRDFPMIEAWPQPRGPMHWLLRVLVGARCWDGLDGGAWVARGRRGWVMIWVCPGTDRREYRLRFLGGRCHRWHRPPLRCWHVRTWEDVRRETEAEKETKADV